MKFTLMFAPTALVMLVAWILARTAINIRRRDFKITEELKLFTVFLSILAVTRFVYFSYFDKSFEGLFIGTLNFDSHRIFPMFFNLNLLVEMDYTVSVWRYFAISNILLFIPVGFCWPLCFKKLNFFTTVLAGALYSFLIEVSQLFLFDRYTDIADFAYNTLGAIVGAALYFLIAGVTTKGKKRRKR